MASLTISALEREKAEAEERIENLKRDAQAANVKTKEWEELYMLVAFGDGSGPEESGSKAKGKEKKVEEEDDYDDDRGKEDRGNGDSEGGWGGRGGKDRYVRKRGKMWGNHY